MSLRLTGKRVLITVGTGGIGRVNPEGFAAAALVKIAGFRRMTLPFATPCRF
jgi:short-subunit dehydrogenase involved in D-alanine esterification of teichoic acids